MRLASEKQNDLNKERTIVLTYKELQYIEACVGIATPSEIKDYLKRQNKSAYTNTNTEKISDDVACLYDEINLIYVNFFKGD